MYAISNALKSELEKLTREMIDKPADTDKAANIKRRAKIVLRKLSTTKKL